MNDLKKSGAIDKYTKLLSHSHAKFLKPHRFTVSAIGEGQDHSFHKVRESSWSVLSLSWLGLNPSTFRA